LVGRREVRETDALLLKVKDPGLFSSHISKPGTKTGFKTYKNGQRMWGWTSISMDVVANYLEGTFKEPVIMEPGFTQTYDLSFRWDTIQRDDSREKSAAITQELAQAGLELVPSREPIEMLVVEKSK